MRGEDERMKGQDERMKGEDEMGRDLEINQ